MIVGAGTMLNTATVLAGGGLGTIAGGRVPERVRETAVEVLGLFVCVLGVRTAIVAAFDGGRPPDLAIVLLGLIVGGALGALVGIDAALARFGQWVEDRVAPVVADSGQDAGDGVAPVRGRVAHAFVTTSLLFCVGPLTVLGCLDDATRGDILLLGIKSSLDGVAALAFAVSLGWGVLLSAGSVVAVQGTLTAVFYVNRGALDQDLVTQALGAGGILLVAIGLGLLGLKRIRTADLLPALAVAPLLELANRSWGLHL
jgi:uncharacterized membrane protein YqgA involved in biofilm formation